MAATLESPLPSNSPASSTSMIRTAARWPMTSLLDILKEADLRTDFTGLFTTSATREALPKEVLRKRLLLCLYGLGTNTGLKRVGAGDPDGSTYQDLRYVRRKYITRERLRAAIAHLANAVFRIRRPEIWGEGSTACASDSKKFGAWDQNLLTEWSIRHRGTRQRVLVPRGWVSGVGRRYARWTSRPHRFCPGLFLVESEQVGSLPLHAVALYIEDTRQGVGRSHPRRGM